MGFKERLAEARKAKKLSQEALGALMGGEDEKMSKQGISHWETGRYEPSLSQLARLCEILDCSADWLLFGRSPENLPPDALAQARIFARLDKEKKKSWIAITQAIFSRAASDATVEAKMPITKKSAEAQK